MADHKSEKELESEFRKLMLEGIHGVTRSQADIRDSLTKVESKLDLHIQKTEYELEKINELDDHQNRLLDEHIQGVRTLKEMHMLQQEYVDKRFDEVEAPKKALKLISKWIIGAGAVAGATFAILRLFEIL